MSKVLESSQTDGRARKKVERVAVRLTPEVKDRLEYAAKITGRSVSDFVVSSALEAAQAHIDRQERFRLAAQDRSIFLSALARPPAPNKALRDAAKRYRNRTRA